MERRLTAEVVWREERKSHILRKEKEIIAGKNNLEFIIAR